MRYINLRLTYLLTMHLLLTGLKIIVAQDDNFGHPIVQTWVQVTRRRQSS